MWGYCGDDRAYLLQHCYVIVGVTMVMTGPIIASLHESGVTMVMTGSITTLLHESGITMVMTGPIIT